jgi:hypothetical protein
MGEPFSVFRKSPRFLWFAGYFFAIVWLLISLAALAEVDRNLRIDTVELLNSAF